ncbi:MAG: DPP IV N-terminal domain-containing protein [Acidobacteriota bacterium]
MFTSIVGASLNVQAQDQQDLKQKLGIIVRPGGIQRLGVADFLLRTGASQPDVNTFNEVLAGDLQFAGLIDIVGKSLYPKVGLASPVELKIEEWNADPARLDYLAFGQIKGDGVEAYLYDVKTRSGLIEKTYRGTSIRQLAHQFADEILKKLFNIDGIATSKIAYTTSKEIMVMDYDGFGQRVLIRDGSYAILPSLSPDGSKVAYISYKTTRPTIEVHSANDGLPYSFATPPRGTVSSPQFSPDGSLMAYACSKDSDAMEIYISTTDGNRPRRLTNNRGIIDTSPRWNPKTGQQISFISDRSGTPQIYIMDLDGSNVQRVLTHGGQADAPAWSPDGQFIAYTWRPAGAGSSDIYVLDVASGQILQLTSSNGGNEAPSWAPDSRHIAFQSNRTGRWEVWIMNIDGTGEKQVSKGGGRSPSWSR